MMSILVQICGERCWKQKIVTLLLLQLLEGQTLTLHLCGGYRAGDLGTQMKRQGSQPLGAQILMGKIIRHRG